jgi:hypothetical protein
MKEFQVVRPDTATPPHLKLQTMKVPNVSGTPIPHSALRIPHYHKSIVSCVNHRRRGWTLAVLGLRGHDRALLRRDTSRQSKAATCRRTPKVGDFASVNPLEKWLVNAYQMVHEKRQISIRPTEGKPNHSTNDKNMSKCTPLLPLYDVQWMYQRVYESAHLTNRAR